MAPSISPKKSWEGAAGSALACVIGGIATVVLILDGTWWAGAIVGLALVLSATVGDLTESTIKRDLGIKDLGLSLIHISEPTRRTPISYAVFCLKKKNKYLR